MKQVIELNLPVWRVEEEMGYKPITTFWSDFSIAENFGAEAVKDTFKRAFLEWRDKYKYLTELVMVLNHKIWQWYEHDDNLSRLYNDLWCQADCYAGENLKGEELEYFYITLD